VIAVAFHRRQLPILDPCHDFVPAPGSADEGGFCDRCQKHVHDVSTMRESELRRFLAAHAGTRVCVSYRADAQGRLQLHPEPAAATGPAALALGALALLLAACAGHAVELDAPGTGCRDAEGYEVSCPVEWSDPSMLSTPELADPIASREVEADGDPVQPPGSEPAPAGAQDLEPLGDSMRPPPDVSFEDPAATPSDASPTAEPTSVRVRANFSIDPAAEFVRFVGVVVANPSPRRLHFVPTKQLWDDWQERRAERKAARQRWRAARLAATSE